MIDLFKQLIASQFEASLCTLAHSIEHCPGAAWDVRVARYPFCQVAFHTLFFADYYLEPSADSLKTQPFHLANPTLFGDYEQLEYREPVALYDRAQIRGYLDFCRQKASQTLAAETEVTLSARAQFDRKTFTRAELHVYNIRHIQHHAAQLILRLRLDANVDIPWMGTGWRDPVLSADAGG